MQPGSARSRRARRPAVLARGRAVRAALAAVLAGLSVAACSAPSRATPSTTAPKSATAASVGDVGGLAALVDLAKREGTLTLGGVDPELDGNAAVIRGFQAAYGLGVQTTPAAGPATAGEPAPDVVALADAAARERVAGTEQARYAAYTTAHASTVPDGLADPGRRWVAEATTLVAIGYDSRRVAAPASWADLAGPAYRGAVALADDPRYPGPAQDAVVTVGLGRGGTPALPAPGVAFFTGLRTAGILQALPASDDRIRAGQTTVAIDSEQAHVARKAALGAGAAWRLVVPPGPVVGQAVAVAVRRDAPHPAAARLWLEYVLSDDAQNLRLKAGLRPARLAAMVAAGVQDKQAYAALPLLQGTPVYPTAAQQSAAQTAIVAGWGS